MAAPTAGLHFTRDLLRRRNYLMHLQSELLAHIQNTRSQYNLPAFEKRIRPAANRADLADHFPEPMVRESIEADIQMLETLHSILLKMERTVIEQARPGTALIVDVDWQDGRRQLQLRTEVTHGPIWTLYPLLDGEWVVWGPNGEYEAPLPGMHNPFA